MVVGVQATRAKAVRARTVVEVKTARARVREAARGRMVLEVRAARTREVEKAPK